MPFSENVTVARVLSRPLHSNDEIFGSNMDLEQQTFRHQCEVRHFLNMRIKQGREAVTTQLSGIETRRGTVACKQLKDDINQQWQLGNRGEYGVWFQANDKQTSP